MSNVRIYWLCTKQNWEGHFVKLCHSQILNLKVFDYVPKPISENIGTINGSSTRNTKHSYPNFVSTTNRWKSWSTVHPASQAMRKSWSLAEWESHGWFQNTNNITRKKFLFGMSQPNLWCTSNWQHVFLLIPESSSLRIEEMYTITVV